MLSYFIVEVACIVRELAAPPWNPTAVAIDLIRAVDVMCVCRYFCTSLVRS